jgi:hypothetical protein
MKVGGMMVESMDVVRMRGRWTIKRKEKEKKKRREGGREEDEKQ